MNILDKFILGFIAMYMLLEVISIRKHLKINNRELPQKYTYETRAETDRTLGRIELEYTHNWSSRGGERYLSVDRLEEIIKELREELIKIHKRLD